MEGEARSRQRSDGCCRDDHSRASHRCEQFVCSMVQFHCLLLVVLVMLSGL
jgi:hypothetical protein